MARKAGADGVNDSVCSDDAVNLDDIRDVVLDVLREERQTKEESEEDRIAKELDESDWRIVRLIELRTERREKEERRAGLSEKERLIEDLYEDEALIKVARFLEISERESRDGQRKRKTAAGAAAVAAAVATYVLPIVAIVRAHRDSRSLRGRLRRLLS